MHRNGSILKIKDLKNKGWNGRERKSWGRVSQSRVLVFVRNVTSRLPQMIKLSLVPPFGVSVRRHASSLHCTLDLSVIVSPISYIHTYLCVGAVTSSGANNLRYTSVSSH
jgi:hypothetical protein